MQGVGITAKGVSKRRVLCRLIQRAVSADSTCCAGRCSVLRFLPLVVADFHPKAILAAHKWIIIEL